jgi:hypothetical protein
MAIPSSRCHERSRMLNKFASRGRTVGTDSRQNKDDRSRNDDSHRTRFSRYKELHRPSSRARRMELQRRDPDIKPSDLEILAIKSNASSEIGWLIMRM